MIKILIADDHAIVRQGLRQVAAITPDLVCAGEARNGHEVIDKIQQEDFDILLLDLTMPGPSGIELIQRVRRDRPTLPILVLSMHSESQIAARVLKAGAAGYVTKDNEPETLISAIRKVAGGGRYIDPQLAEKLVFDHEAAAQDPHELLSEREYQVLRMFAAGKSINEIADDLCLSAKTITTHKIRIMHKLNVRSNAELIRLALRHHVIE